MGQRGIEQRVMRQVNKANRDFSMIGEGDRILVALSGGKDSYVLLWALQRMQAAVPFNFDLVAYHLDQGQPGYDGGPMVRFMKTLDIPTEFETQDTYTAVVSLTEEGKAYCSACSRFRRAILYKAAERHGCNKVALGHHRDDLIETLLMNLFYSGQMKSMPPRLINDAGTHEVIRPLCYAREDDLASLSQFHNYEIMPCTLCGSQATRRQYIKGLLSELSKEQRHLKGNLLSALGNVHPSHLMDPKLNPLYPNHSDLDSEDIDDPEQDHLADAVVDGPAQVPGASPLSSQHLPILSA